MSGNDVYTVVVARSGRSLLSLWAWEIYRNGKPLPARLSKGGYKSEHNANRGGVAALREFKSALEREESKDDC
jgi:hypothetical protein